MAPHRNCVAGIPMNGFVRSRNKIPDELAKLSLRDLKWKLKQELAGTAAYGKAKNGKSESMKKQAHNISNLNSGKQQPRPDNNNNNNNNIIVEDNNNNTLKSYSSRGLRRKVRSRETPESCIRLQLANYLSRKDNLKKFASRFITFLHLDWSPIYHCHHISYDVES